MCGIIGFNWKDKEKLVGSLKHLTHRGPDNQGFFFDNNMSLGHTRLSIIDLSDAGKQPMLYEYQDRKVQITYNGEIYNFQTIKKELENKGYLFKTKTDTEVILASYLEYGFDCVEQFNGMWAFCIYDLEKKILFLSRDRLGQKPLHYYWDGNKFIFSSEIKSILYLGILNGIDKEGLDLYFSLGFIPSPYTIYKNIRKLEPRNNLIVDLEKKIIEKKKYYELPTYKPEYNKKKLIKEGRELLKDATRLRLIADVPIGAFLSGGLDSSVTVAEMAEFLDPRNLHTFSIGFDGKYDETPYINIVNAWFNTKHHHEYFREKDFENMLEDIFYYFDEPFADISMFPTTAVSRLARELVTVSLSGDGGDEIFGGYWLPQMGIKIILLQKIPKRLRLLLYKLLHKSIHSPGLLSQLKEGLRISFEPSELFYTELLKGREYQPEISVRWTNEKFKECLRLSNGNLIEALIKIDYYYMSLSDTILSKVDRASMKYALEIRSPFLDYRFIEYSTRIPVKWKISRKKKKILLRQLIKGIVPDEIVTRKKGGFTPPLQEWILKKKYIEEIKILIKELSRDRILNDELKDYYEKIVEKKNYNWRDRKYLIRMFLFGRWTEKWAIEKNLKLL